MLSDRLRPDCEAAPWVIDEVKALERALQLIADFPLEEFGKDKEPSDRTLIAFNQWHLTIGDVKQARKMLGIVKKRCRPCDGSVTPEQIASCGFGRCPHKNR